MGKVTSQIMSKDMIDSKNKANVDMGSLSNRVDNLTNISNSMVYVESYPIQNGETDDTLRIQRAINALNGKGTVVLSTGKTYNVSQLNVSGVIEIIGNGSTLNSISVDNTTPMIVNNQNASNLRITNLNFNGKNKFIELRLDGIATGKGLSLSLYKVSFQGLTKVADAIYLRQIDFVEMTKVSAYNVNTFLRIESDYTISERANTQIHLKNLSLLQVNLGFYFRQVDKATLDGVDISQCGSGYYFYADNQHMQLNTCHVEFYGKNGYNGGINYGYGYYFPDDKSQPDISLNNCTSYLPIDGALGGVYLGQSESLLTNVLFDNCYFAYSASLPSHFALYLYGSYIWKGRFPYDNTNVKTNKASMSKGNGIIEENGWPVHKSKNLLPFSLISSASQVNNSVGTGTITVSNDVDGIFNKARLITMTASASYERYTTLSLKTGWHTLLISGYKKTGSPFVYVQQLGSPYTNMVKVLLSSQQNNMVRIPFYVGTAGSYKVGFNPSADCSLVLNQIEVVRGFGKDFITDTSVSKQTAIPTEGYYDLGDTIVNTSPSASGYMGWVCVTSPSTFKGYGLIQA